MDYKVGDRVRLLCDGGFVNVVGVHEGAFGTVEKNEWGGGMWIKVDGKDDGNLFFKRDEVEPSNTPKPEDVVFLLFGGGKTPLQFTGLWTVQDHLEITAPYEWPSRCLTNYTGEWVEHTTVQLFCDIKEGLYDES